MITLVVGPPGAGKGLFLMRVVSDILLDTKLTIVTNFALKLDELNVWLQREHPEVSVDLGERVYILGDGEIRSFYLRRGAGRVIAAATDEQVKEDIFQDYGPANGWASVAYVIDEADIIFDAREYARTGRPVNFYNKQHRKLGDQVYYCCQSPEQLDKKFRMVTEQTIVLKNLGQRRLGLFKLPAGFLWSRFYKVPGPMSPSEQQGIFRMPLRAGLENCFATAAGVGMSGLMADKGDKKKGLSIWWGAALLLLVLGMIPICERLFMRAMAAPGKAMMASMNKATHSMAREVGLEIPTNALPSGMVAVEHHEAALPASLIRQPAGAVTNAVGVWLTGLWVRSNHCRVFLSDGTVWSERDPELSRVSQRGVVIDGRAYRFRYDHSGEKLSSGDHGAGQLGQVDGLLGANGTPQPGKRH